METTKLISMTDFVIQEKFKPISIIEFADRVCNYAEFLKQPLKLEMFVPCDYEGNILIDPCAEDNDAGTEIEIRQIEYNNAKSKVIFEGFMYIHAWFGGHIVAKNKNGNCQISLFDFDCVEELLNEERELNVTLTETALKQIKL